MTNIRSGQITEREGGSPARPEGKGKVEGQEDLTDLGFSTHVVECPPELGGKR